MADVARQAGVHKTTISLALRNHPSIPAATRQRLQALAEETGYRPDPALRALIAYRRRARPPTKAPPLAYLTHWDSRWGWKLPRAQARFYAGAAVKAVQLGYKLEHFWLGEPKLTHERMSDILVARGISGLIVASHLPETDVPLRLAWPHFSAVKIDYYPHEPELHTVTNDHRAIIQLAMRRVIAAGYRRIGFVMPSWWDHFADLAWSAGFLAEQQVLAPEEKIPIFHFSDAPPKGMESVEGRETVAPREAFGEWLRQFRPEVLISKEQFVQPRLAELGLAVPRDIAFAEIFLDPDGQTAGVRHNCERVGELAVEILDGQLQHYSYGVPSFPTTTLVEGTWFDGKSLPLRSPASKRRSQRSCG